MTTLSRPPAFSPSNSHRYRTRKVRSLSDTDAAMTFLSWMGRALLLSGYHNNWDIAKPCTMMALATAKDLGEDLFNATDSFLWADSVCRIVTPPEAFSNAPKFLFNIFNRLKELSGAGNWYHIDSDKDISINGLEARYWLLRVHITGMSVDLKYLTNSSFSSIDSANSSTINWIQLQYTNWIPLSRNKCNISVTKSQTWISVTVV